MGNQQSYQIEGVPVSWGAFKKECKKRGVDLDKHPSYKPQYRGSMKEKPIFNYEDGQVWIMN